MASPRHSDEVDREVIGVIPAAGQATRLAPLPCSKELLPVGFRDAEGQTEKRPKAACLYLLERMRAAGVNRAYVVLREGKWDIPAYLRDGALVGMQLAYLVAALPYGVPYSVDQAYPFVRKAIVAFGFPDILFQTEDVFAQLLSRLAIVDDDVLLGLFPTEIPQAEDLVELSGHGRVIRLVIKPSQTDLRYTWGIAIWTPRFTDFLHEYVEAHKAVAAVEPEPSVGHAIQEAIQNGLRVGAIHVSDEPYVDIGTPDNLMKAIRNLAIQ